MVIGGAAGELGRQAATLATASRAANVARIALAGGKAANLPTVASAIPAFRYQLTSMPNVGLLGAGLANLTAPGAGQ